jgi:hypothetical protein
VPNVYQPARGKIPMTRRTVFLFAVIVFAMVGFSAKESFAQQAYGRQWGHTYSTQDWNRMYHYPYVYYPQNYYGRDYYRSSDDMYHRYPAEMQIPVYNKSWANFYPEHRKDPRFTENLIFPFTQRHSGSRYSSGHHFVMDIF